MPNDFDYRPITFQGETFPVSLMAISILAPVLGLPHDELGEWLWRLPICGGVQKSASAERCVRCARQAADLMLEHRQRVIEGIRERMEPDGFDPETTYREWLLALQRIVDLSRAATGDCSWSAPMHANDKCKTAADAKRLMDALERVRAKFLATGELDIKNRSHDTGTD